MDVVCDSFVCCVERSIATPKRAGARLWFILGSTDMPSELILVFPERIMRLTHHCRPCGVSTVHCAAKLP